MTILLAARNATGGMLLIDEVEAGFHYSTLPKVWAALADVAERFDVQIFATTHSWECLGAAHEHFEGGQADSVTYHRLDRDQAGIRCSSFDQSDVGTALELGVELR